MPRRRRPAPSRRSWRVASAVLAVGLGLALTEARADDPGSLSAGTQDLDDVGGTKPSALDEVGRDAPVSLDSRGEASELDRIPDARTGSIEEVNRAAGPWRPPPCDLSLPPDAEVPETDDVDLWRQVLEEARLRLEETQAELRRAERGFVRLNTDPRRDAEAPEARDALEKARSQYARARCALPALLEAARRAGVPPGTLREVRQQLPADLEPGDVRY